MVAPVVIAAGVAAGASLIGGLMSQASNAKSLQQQKDLVNQARAEFEKIQNPEQKALVYEELRKQGVFTPELEQTFNAPDTGMSKINVDPTLRQAQMDALYQLSQVGKTGLTDADEVAIEKSRSNMIGDQSRRDASIQENFARRGVNSAGLELVARQQAGQDLSNRMGDFEQNIQAEARNRALQAMMQRGQLASGIRDQEFSEEAQKAKAVDAVNQFNAQNRQRVSGANVDRGNQAQLQNLAESQRIADANVGMRNSANQYNIGADQRTFENRMAIAAGKNGQVGNAVSVNENARKAGADMWSGLITGVNKGVATWANSKKKDEEKV